MTTEASVRRSTLLQLAKPPRPADARSPESAVVPVESRHRSLLRRLLPPAILLIAAGAVGAAMLYRTDPSAAAPPLRPVEVIQRFPHDDTAFCQGLVYHDQHLLEGTGQYHRSRLRRVDIDTGRSVEEIRLPGDVFGEGITVVDDRILQLTWQNRYLIVYDVSTLQRTATVSYRDIDPQMREGWGITFDGTHLIISDGTSTLRFCDPQTYRVVRRQRVRNGFRSLSQINELEYVDGLILANVWYEDRIARIDPASGEVVDWLDLRQIRPREVQRNREAVLNGIAWDAEHQRLFVTGKHWPALFEIRVPAPAER